MELEVYTSSASEQLSLSLRLSDILTEMNKNIKKLTHMESMLLTDDIINITVSLVTHMFLVDMQFPVQQFTAGSKSFRNHNSTPGSVGP